MDKWSRFCYTSFVIIGEEKCPLLLEAYPIELENCDPDEDFIESETVMTITPSSHGADRSIARRASLQILYELDSTCHALPKVLEAHLQERPESHAVRQIIRRFVEGVSANRENIDRLIQQYAPEWPIDQVAIIDRNILRIAIYEYLLQKRVTPVPVIINEAVNLAQLFGAENSHSFVHGVLGTVTSDESVALRLQADEVGAP